MDLHQYRVGHMESIIVNRRLLMPIDILMVGATGTGKSATLNALFQKTVAKVGLGAEPETEHISSYQLHNSLRFHDSAGLGDGVEADKKHAQNIARKLYECCAVQGAGTGQGYRLIDLVLVILDGGSKDLGTAYKLLESVVLKSIEAKRVIVAVNQADMAMKGRHWCHESNQPDDVLYTYLKEQSSSIKARILESTGCTISKPVFYSATRGYHIQELIDHLIEHFPESRRCIGM